MPGTYVLIMRAPETIAVTVGSLGPMTLPAGYYLYVGSALGGLWHRLERHLATSKRLHWHVDYVLQIMPIMEIWYRIGRERVECVWAQALAASDHVQAVGAVGASDCVCRTHLFRSKEMPDPAWFAGNPTFVGIERWAPPPRACGRGAPDGQG